MKMYQNWGSSLPALGQRRSRAGRYPADPSTFFSILWIFHDKQTTLDKPRENDQQSSNERDVFFFFFFFFSENIGTAAAGPAGPAPAPLSWLGFLLVPYQKGAKFTVAKAAFRGEIQVPLATPVRRQCSETKFGLSCRVTWGSAAMALGAFLRYAWIPRMRCQMRLLLVRATINVSRSSLDDKRAERDMDMAPQQKSKTNHVKGKRERKKEARRMRLSLGSSMKAAVELAYVLPGKRALFSVQKSSQPQPLILAERMRAARAASPWTPSTDWLSRCCEPWKRDRSSSTHVQQSHTRKTGRSKKRRWSFNGFHNWMLEKRHKNVTQTFLGLNLNTINASASGLWQIKTAHKNLGCASVFMTVFICHKPSAFAYTVGKVL